MSDLKQPIFLSREDVEGGWRDLFPELAKCLPPPSPIYSRDEEKIVTNGYPMLISAGIHKFRRSIQGLVQAETEYRLALATTGEQGEKRTVMVWRGRYLRSMSAIMKNCLLNNFSSGLPEMLLLFHYDDIAQVVASVPGIARKLGGEKGLRLAERFRFQIIAVFTDLLQRATKAAVDELRNVATLAPAYSPLLAIIQKDPLLLSETRTPGDFTELSGYLRIFRRQDPAALATARNNAMENLRSLLEGQRELKVALRLATRSSDFDNPRILLDSAVLDAIVAMGLTARIKLDKAHVSLFRDLGMRLKQFELLRVMQDWIKPVKADGPELVLSGPTPTPIARSIRPMDFIRPGVIESSVRRFGMVYDLTNFTKVLEKVRKKGSDAGDHAMRAMQSLLLRLEKIRAQRGLTYEKFLGDGGLYTSRRAVQVIAMACEIQLVYDEMCKNGFPFDLGVRIAMNYSSYRLMPMPSSEPGPVRYEFFGHGIVELSRLTTGKSTKEIEQISDFLVQAGYEACNVDKFLTPLMAARDGHGKKSGRPYPAEIVGGELDNEGIVLTLQFIEELDSDIRGFPLHEVEKYGLNWLLVPLDPDEDDTKFYGLRYMGVAHLKGLQPLEMCEAVVWTELPAGARPVTAEESLLAHLRRLAQIENDNDDYDYTNDPNASSASVRDDLVLVTYLEKSGRRRWVFGEHDSKTDYLLHTIQTELKPDIGPDEPLDNWIFRSRLELACLYDGLRRENDGATVPLSTLRLRDGYKGWFLAAPHRAPA